jgi:resolvase-like protein
MSEKIKPHHLERKAILYVRQSSAYQVHNNLESQKLQYAMQERLYDLGWREVEVVDEDLGRSASGAVTRSGFERMVAQVCLGQVGAVAAREVSRFARNSREWQKLVEVCRVVDTLLIDQEMVYTPRQSNDRLLLGLNRPDTQSTSYSIPFEVDESRVFLDFDLQRGLLFASRSRRQIYPTCWLV